jgi:hypothetical protein
MPPPAERPRARHRAPDADRRGPDRRGGQDRRGPDEEPVADPDLDSYLAALAGTNDEHPTELTGRFGHAQVFQLRLPALRIEQLRRIAKDRGVSPGALAVDWVVERLDHEDTPTGPLPVVEDEPKRRGLRRLGRR